MAEKERKIEQNEIGKCPFCDSDNYNRNMRDISDDFVFFDCICDDCKNEFKESFCLVYQEWNDE